MLLRRNIVIDAETAQLVAAVQAALQADAPSRPPRRGPRPRRRQRAAVLTRAPAPGGRESAGSGVITVVSAGTGMTGSPAKIIAGDGGCMNLCRTRVLPTPGSRYIPYGPDNGTWLMRQRISPGSDYAGPRRWDGRRG